MHRGMLEVLRMEALMISECSMRKSSRRECLRRILRWEMYRSVEEWLRECLRRILRWEMYRTVEEWLRECLSRKLSWKLPRRWLDNLGRIRAWVSSFCSR